MNIHELVNMIDHCSVIGKVYILALMIGLVLPAMNLLFSGITDILHLDFHVDTEGVFSDFIPLKPMCILIFLLTFGGFGLLSARYLGDYKSLIVAVLAGYLFALALNLLLIKPMRKKSEGTQKIEDFIGEVCEVRVRIKVGSVGSVSIQSKHGIITYAAILAAGEEKEADYGDTVIIADVNSKEDTVIVKVVKTQQDKLVDVN